jgi:uncharacterized protein YutE (UPF0331/DUF86 family)
MTINGVIQRKLSLMDQDLLRLKQAMAGVDLKAFENNWGLQRIAERTLQVMVEIVIDVCERIVALKGAGPAATAGEAVEKMVQLGLLQSAEPYRSMVRFRNLIVHQYEEIDPAILYDLATNRLDAFRQFRAEIDRL